MTLDDARRYLGIRKQVFTDQPDAARPILEWLIAEVERLRSELAEAKAIINNLPKWQPFATAPKDNAADIIAWREDAGTFTVFWGPPGLAYRDADSEQSDWCWFDSRGEDLTGNLPTLWMPLPELDDDTRETAEAAGEEA